MKFSKFAVSLLALVLLASCGGKTSSSVSEESKEPESSQVQPSSEAAPTYEAYTLSQLHEARAAKTLASLDKKFVATKGKVTYAKREGNFDIMFIQNGKYAVEVTYPAPFSVNVGDAVEVKGQLQFLNTGATDTIFLSAYQDTYASNTIQVINEAIETESVTLTKEADLVEYDGSIATIDFTVSLKGPSTALFSGKLSDDEGTFIVASKLGSPDKIEGQPYEVDEEVRYSGVFTYSATESAKIIRYFNKDGFSKID